MRRRDLAALLPSAGRYAARYWRQQRRGGATPMVLSFLVTARCPLRCQHCFYHYAEGDPAAEELSLDEYRRLAASLGDVGLGLFCGGEPFVRSDLAEIVDVFHEDCHLLAALASTNGQLTAAVVEQSERILRRHPTRPFVLSLSLDGFAEQHDRNRGVGSFQRAVRTWRECERLARHHPNLVLTVTFVLSSLNQHVAPRFVRWVWSELGPSYVGVLLVRQTPRAGEHLKDVHASCYREAQGEALRPLTQSRLWWLDHPELPLLGTIARGVHHTMTTGTRSFRCHAGRHGAVVDPFGQLSACEALAEQADVGSMGSLRSAGMDFSAVWRSPAAGAVRRWVGRHDICASCTHETMGYLSSVLFAGNQLHLDARELTA